MPMPVLIELTQRPLGEAEIRPVDDLDDILEAAGCSCSSSDDQPYQ